MLLLHFQEEDFEVGPTALLNNFGKVLVLFIYLYIWKRCTGERNKVAHQLLIGHRDENQPPPQFPLFCP